MHDLLRAAGAVLLCLLAADFASGVVHWFEDTWLAPGISPLIDRLVVEPNIGHHRLPGGIRSANYASTNAITIGIATLFAAVLALAHVTAWQPYLIAAIGSQANQVHAWAHTSRPPRVIAALQRIGLLQSSAHHAVHHRRPYAVRFCSITPLLNPLLDALRFWRALEHIVELLGGHIMRATAARSGF